MARVPYDGKPAFEVPARNIMPKPLLESDYFIAKQGYVAPSNQKFYNDDRLNPYAYDEGSNSTGSDPVRSAASR